MKRSSRRRRRSRRESTATRRYSRRCGTRPPPSACGAVPFVRPVPQEANSAFGTRSIFNGKPRNAHGGADFLSPAGTPIHAPNAGRVVVARDLYFSGNTVVIDHGLGLFSMLAHLSRDRRPRGRSRCRRPAPRTRRRDRARYRSAPALGRTGERRTRRPVVLAGDAWFASDTRVMLARGLLTPRPEV